MSAAVRPEALRGGGADAVRPFVSVVVPTYRNRAGAEAAVRSVLACGYPADRFEIVVVDGTSRDGTAERIAELALESPVRLRVLEVEPFGPSASRDAGIEASTGEIVAFIDSDCVAAPGWLDAGVAALQSASSAGFVQGRTLPPPGAQLRTRSRYVLVDGPDPAHHACNLFYRREALEAVGGFSKYYYFDVERVRRSWLSRVWSAWFRIRFVLHCSAEDTDLGWRVVDAGWPKRYCPEALVYHEVRLLSPFWWMLDTALYCSGIPRLAKRHPGLRAHLYGGHFLAPADAWLALLLLGCGLAAAAHPAWAALGAPYVVARGREPSVFWRGPLRLFRFLFYLPRDCATFCVLLWRSIRHGYVVL